MKIKIDWPSTVFAILTLVVLLSFPFLNPCQSEDGFACTWNADENGLGTSFTDYYGVTIPR